MENRKIARFEKDVLRHIRNDIDAALKTVCEKYGVVFKIGNIKFSNVEFNTKMTCVIVGQTLEGLPTVNPDQVVFNQHCTRFSLNASDFGAKFHFGSDTFEICGIKLGSHKYPILAKKLSDGRTFKFAPSIIRDRLDAKRRVDAALAMPAITSPTFQ